MKIAILMEGETERVFLPFLREFLNPKLAGEMPRLVPRIYNGRIDKGDKLRRVVDALLRGPEPDADHVIALTDVYTGTKDFEDAADAKQKMRSWVGHNPKFHPHAAQYDFEAWLLPYWSTIQNLAKHNLKVPSGKPESVNHNKPPAHRIREIFAHGRSPRHYVKTRDARRILEGKDLGVAVSACPELKAFVNTILTLCGAETL
jgi:hypothetical protein